jgi:NAD-dependent SIR2 family protein deacetylase
MNENYQDKIAALKEKIASAEAVVVGAGAGMSTAAGLTYDGPRFLKYFADFHNKYGITDMYAGGFYPYKTLEEFWAWWSRQILYNRYEVEVGKPYADLFEIVKDKNYFVLTTNVDHQFQLAGFDKTRLFYTQGDYGLFQCSDACHDKTYDNEKIVREMVAQQKDMRVPTELVPYCPVCGKPMTTNLRSDDNFVEDEGWYAAYWRYKNFLEGHKDKKVVFLELGVGMNTPGIIKYPFWRMAGENKNATYAAVNIGGAHAPEEIKDRSICLSEDIAKVLNDIKG